MVGAAWYLVVCSIKNRIRRRLGRLKEPRYLVGSVVGVLYLTLMLVGRHGDRHAASGRLDPSVLALLTGPVEVFGSLVLCVMACVAWLLPGIGRGLEFTRAEVQFLFTAPVTRRALLHYKILRSQIGVLIGSAVAVLIMRPGSLNRAWTILVGMWLVLMLVRLYLTGASLSRSSLGHHGLSGLRRQWLPLCALGTVIGVVTMSVVAQWGDLTKASGADGVFAIIQRLVQSGPSGWVLLPFRAPVRLPLSVSVNEFLQRLPGVLVLLTLTYAWVLRSDTRFEEAAAEQAERRAAVRSPASPITPLGLMQPFRLASHGRPEVAILWKNLILLGRHASLRIWLRLLPVGVVLAVLVARGGTAAGVGAWLATVCPILAGLLVMLGPQFVQNDLRQDLEKLAVLKTWPVTGATIIRGAVLGPTVVLTAVVWSLLVMALAAASPMAREASVVGGVVMNRYSWVLAAALVAPGLVLIQVIVINGLAVLFPAWVSVGHSRARGLDAMGQRLLLMAALALGLVLGALPGILIGGVALLAGRIITGVSFVILPALVATAVMVAECALAAELLGRVLDHTDAATVEPSE